MRPTIIAIAGKSGSGKTTLLEKIIPILKNRGHRIGTVKHAHKEVEIDKKGKDSWRHRQAGAHATLVVSPDTIALVKDRETDSLEALAAHLSDMDLIIVEGFKRERIPKIEIFRTDSKHKEPLCLDDPDLVAFVTDSRYTPAVPIFGLDDIEALADFIEADFILTGDILLNQERTN